MINISIYRKGFKQDFVSKVVQVEKTTPLIKFYIKRKSECYKCLCIGLDELDPATIMPVAVAIPE